MRTFYAVATAQPRIQRFACTQCGMCCNRPPEVALSEATKLADVFVFRMMFRLYSLPDRVSDFLALQGNETAASFYGKKRLLSAFAARQYAFKDKHGGRSVPSTRYLLISALALGTVPGMCPVLRGGRCGIYDRRPLSCRSVPFHYSRSEALAEAGLDAFVKTAGYGCDTSENAAIVMQGGKIVDPAALNARSEAVETAERDKIWAQAIARRMSDGEPLPTLQEVEANASFGALTSSMVPAWQIAADRTIISTAERERLITVQLNTIDQTDAEGCSPDIRQTLADMRAEYRKHLASAIPFS